MSSTQAGQYRREQARLAAQQVERAQARHARLAVTGALVLVAVVVALAVAQSPDDGPDAALAASSDGLQTGPPPWPARAEGLAERVAGLGFPPVGDESYHAHVLLTVYRDGEQVAVPADLGYDERGGHSSVHTHTPDGVIHMEADDPYPYTLAHVMTTWGVAFGRDRLGGDTASGDDEVHVHVNGEPARPDVVLRDGDDVVVAYGPDGSFPTLPPANALDAE